MLLGSSMAAFARGSGKNKGHMPLAFGCVETDGGSVGQILSEGEAASTWQGQARGCMYRLLVWGILGRRKMTGNLERERSRRMCFKLKDSVQLGKVQRCSREATEDPGNILDARVVGPDA